MSATENTDVPQDGRPLEIREERVVLNLSGDLTLASVPLVRLHLLTLAADDGPRELILNLSGVLAVDAAGLAPLLEAHGLVGRRGGVLILGVVSLPVARFLLANADFRDLRSARHRRPAPVPRTRDDDGWESRRAAAIRDVRDLQDALLDGETIARALGVIRGRYACDGDTAADFLAVVAESAGLEPVDVSRSVLAAAASGVPIPDGLDRILQAAAAAAAGPPA